MPLVKKQAPLKRTICKMCLERTYPPNGWEDRDEWNWDHDFIYCGAPLGTHNVNDGIYPDCRMAVEQLVLGQENPCH